MVKNQWNETKCLSKSVKIYRLAQFIWKFWFNRKTAKMFHDNRNFSFKSYTSLITISSNETSHGMRNSPLLNWTHKMAKTHAWAWIGQIVWPNVITQLAILIKTHHFIRQARSSKSSDINLWNFLTS